MGFFIKLKQKFASFMYGRYGPDNLYNFLFLLYLILALLNAFIGSLILWVIETVLIFLIFFRFFSRNTWKRSEENRKYLAAKSRVMGIFSLSKSRVRDRKTHIYKKCPSCSAMLRLPKRSGEHTVRCPRCGNRFDVRVH